MGRGVGLGVAVGVAVAVGRSGRLSTGAKGTVGRGDSWTGAAVGPVVGSDAAVGLRASKASGWLPAGVGSGVGTKRAWRLDRLAALGQRHPDAQDQSIGAAVAQAAEGDGNHEYQKGNSQGKDNQSQLGSSYSLGHNEAILTAMGDGVNRGEGEAE